MASQSVFDTKHSNGNCVHTGNDNGNGKNRSTRPVVTKSEEIMLTLCRKSEDFADALVALEKQINNPSLNVPNLIQEGDQDISKAQQTLALFRATLQETADASRELEVYLVARDKYCK